MIKDTPFNLDESMCATISKSAGYSKTTITALAPHFYEVIEEQVYKWVAREFEKITDEIENIKYLLRACYDVGILPDSLKAFILKAISPSSKITEEDIVWAKTKVMQKENPMFEVGKSYKTVGGDTVKVLEIRENVMICEVPWEERKYVFYLNGRVSLNSTSLSDIIPTPLLDSPKEKPIFEAGKKYWTKGGALVKVLEVDPDLIHCEVPWTNSIWSCYSDGSASRSGPSVRDLIPRAVEEASLNFSNAILPKNSLPNTKENLEQKIEKKDQEFVEALPLSIDIETAQLQETKLNFITTEQKLREELTQWRARAEKAEAKINSARLIIQGALQPDVSTEHVKEFARALAKQLGFRIIPAQPLWVEDDNG